MTICKHLVKYFTFKDIQTDIYTHTRRTGIITFTINNNSRKWSTAKIHSNIMVNIFMVGSVNDNPSHTTATDILESWQPLKCWQEGVASLTVNVKSASRKACHCISPHKVRMKRRGEVRAPKKAQLGGRPAPAPSRPVVVLKVKRSSRTAALHSCTDHYPLASLIWFLPRTCCCLDCLSPAGRSYIEWHEDVNT